MFLTGLSKRKRFISLILCRRQIDLLCFVTVLTSKKILAPKSKALRINSLSKSYSSKPTSFIFRFSTINEYIVNIK